MSCKIHPTIQKKPYIYTLIYLIFFIVILPESIRILPFSLHENHRIFLLSEVL
jgi:hypothetical protein